MRVTSETSRRLFSFFPCFLSPCFRGHFYSACFLHAQMQGRWAGLPRSLGCCCWPQRVCCCCYWVKESPETGRVGPVARSPVTFRSSSIKSNPLCWMLRLNVISALPLPCCVYSTGGCWLHHPMFACADATAPKISFRRTRIAPALASLNPFPPQVANSTCILQSKTAAAAAAALPLLTRCYWTAVPTKKKKEKRNKKLLLRDNGKTTETEGEKTNTHAAQPPRNSVQPKLRCDRRPPPEQGRPASQLQHTPTPIPTNRSDQIVSSTRPGPTTRPSI